VNLENLTLSTILKSLDFIIFSNFTYTKTTPQDPAYFRRDRINTCLQPCI
jgi:hypothetical protein